MLIIDSSLFTVVNKGSKIIILQFKKAKNTYLTLTQENNTKWSLWFGTINEGEPDTTIYWEEGRFSYPQVGLDWFKTTYAEANRIAKIQEKMKGLYNTRLRENLGIGSVKRGMIKLTSADTGLPVFVSGVVDFKRLEATPKGTRIYDGSTNFEVTESISAIYIKAEEARKAGEATPTAQQAEPKVAPVEQGAFEAKATNLS